jgi:hypothetical protein
MEKVEKQSNSSSQDLSGFVDNTAAAMTLLRDWLSISESQVCSTEVLSEQLPKINTLLETSMDSISDHFHIVAGNIRKMNECLEVIENNSDVSGPAVESLEQVKGMMQQTNQEIAKIVIDMQFQDRVSQNIVITINIMKAIVEYFELEVSHSLPKLSKDERKKLLDIDFAKKLLDQFRLGELQNSFVQHLVEHGYIRNAEEIGYALEQEKQSSDDDIDLF